MKPVHKLIISVLFTALALVIPRLLMAEATIDVLMVESPYAPKPSAEVRTVDKLEGKVFINGQFYSGSLEVMHDNNGLYVVNKLPFERYLEAAVAYEAGRNREVEAVKAQAVISRTLAVFQTRYSNENLSISPGISHILSENKDTEPVVIYALKTTKDEILTYKGIPVKAFFHAACDGKTELPEELWGESYSYIKSVDCNLNSLIHETWQKKIRTSEIEKALGTTGLKEISIISYTSTGRVKTLKISSDSPEPLSINVMDFRKLLGDTDLPSNQFSIERSGEYTVFRGAGNGHAVGFCQRCAVEMARQGKNYREILLHYFPGTEIQKVDYLKFRAAKSREQE